MQLARSNPFSTSRVSSVALGWCRLDDDPSLDELIQRFHGMCYGRAAIVGPHGSGKSTMLDHLQAGLSSAVTRFHVGTQYEQCTAFIEAAKKLQINGTLGIRMVLRGTVRSGSAVHRALREITVTNRAWFVDGYEQLSWFRRIELLTHTRRRREPLLITSHRKTVLPTLIKRSVSPTTGFRLCLTALKNVGEETPPWLNEAFVAVLLAKHHGNMREVFMELYDRFERDSAQV